MGIRDGWLSTREYAESSGLTQQTVRQWAKAGRLEMRQSGRRIEVREHFTRNTKLRAAATARELARLLSSVDEELAKAAQAIVEELDPLASMYENAAQEDE